MADIKISELGAASAVNATDLFPVTSGGVTVKATAQQIKNYMGVGNLSDLNTTDKSSFANAINEVDSNANNAQQMIAPIQTTLTASKAYAVGEQFIYNGLLYKATAAIAQGGAITINGNCELSESATEQILQINDNLSQTNSTVGSLNKRIYTFANKLGFYIVCDPGNYYGAVLVGVQNAGNTNGLFFQALSGYESTVAQTSGAIKTYRHQRPNGKVDIQFVFPTQYTHGFIIIGGAVYSGELTYFDS